MDELIASHDRRVLSLLTRLLGDAEAARDAAQETWCAIWWARDRLLPSVDPWPFIRTTAVRKAIDLRRRAARHAGPRPDLDALSAPKNDDDAARRDATDLLARAALGSEERASLTLYFLEGCSIREIAAVLEAKEGTVKSWLFRARGKLRAFLTEERPT
jgi:RNA polymerase sigma-70 factor (ECF subfamily)